jgi:3-hydroxy acid dehydrogenase/malonic semialdehyde reductase
MEFETILISGATSGIGKAVAEMLATKGKSILITGRREERLIRLAEDLRNKGANVHVGVFDVRDRGAVAKFAAEIPDEFRKIRVLINNAGLAAGFGPIHDGDPDDWERMIDTNIKGLLFMTKAIIPFMEHVPGAQIVNLGSVAGREVYPNGNVYCASKHAVDAITRSMRIDLLPLGIRVSSVSPGLVNTEFSLVRFNGDAERAAQVYAGFEPLLSEDIADAVRYIIEAPYRITIGDLLIFPSAQASSRDVIRK